jgi:hypothetical protein
MSMIQKMMGMSCIFKNTMQTKMHYYKTKKET